ncbi:MAG TPA: bifunctional riboflavin kinase/FAD synthetase [Alphaproteobacteria bacterium]
MTHYTPIGDAFKPAWQHGVIAIGNFDGVHQGHQALLAQARAIATQKQAPCLALTFAPHPRRFFQPQTPPFLIYDHSTKEKVLGPYVDGVITLPFDFALSQLSATDFIDKILHDGLKAQHIVVGQNFVFGHGRQGHVETLMAHGFDVTALAPVMNESETIYSSTSVRQALQNGDMALAGKLLGRTWSVTGKVIPGEKLGRTLGYPTANITWPEMIIAPRFGIYAVTVEDDGKMIKGVASYGIRPTVNTVETPLLEVHLFDFNGDLYGRELTVSFHHFIRGEEKFRDLESLTKQMHQDCTKAQELLA